MNAEANNKRLMAMLSWYLNNHEEFIDGQMIGAFKEETGFSTGESARYLLAAAMGMDIHSRPEDKKLFNDYFNDMLHELNPKDYEENQYYKNIRIPDKIIDSWELCTMKYKPYQMFVCGDMISKGERIIPQIGYFTEEFAYPVVKEGGREWMMITPNEIETMKKGVAEANGKVAAYGLGLGYYAYMVSEKENVDSVTVVEVDDNAIKLFEEYILPQFGNGHKIKVIKDDAFDFAADKAGKEQFDYIFTDLWHDASDGLPMYRKMKALESKSPGSRFGYWIEPTLECYM